MPEGLLGILKLCLIALIYLFFLRIVWAVASELRAPVTATPAAPRAKTERRQRAGRDERRMLQLVATAPNAMNGRRFDVDDEVTVGRASGCHINLDDTFVSQVHARVFRRDGTLWVEDLGSTNGTFVNDERITATVALAKGDRVRFGETALSVVVKP